MYRSDGADAPAAEAFRAPSSPSTLRAKPGTFPNVTAPPPSNAPKHSENASVSPYRRASCDGNESTPFPRPISPSATWPWMEPISLVVHPNTTSSPSPSSSVPPRCTLSFTSRPCTDECSA